MSPLDSWNGQEETPLSQVLFDLGALLTESTASKLVTAGEEHNDKIKMGTSRWQNNGNLVSQQSYNSFGKQLM